MAAILNSAILDSDTAIFSIQTPCYLLSDSLKNTLPPLWPWLKLIQSDYLELDDGKTILNLPSWWFSHLGFIQTFCTQKHSNSDSTNSIWLTGIHSWLNWWYQPSWILPCWIQTLPSWIQTPCYLLSDSLKNTLPPLWLWLKLIQSWLT